MRLLIGDECGLLKECIPELSSSGDDGEDRSPQPIRGAMPHVAKDGVTRVDPREVLSRSRGLVDITFVADGDTAADSSQLSFAALRQNGSVELWEGSAGDKTRFGEYQKSFSTKVQEDNPRPLGLGYFSNHRRLCAGDYFGNLSILKVETGEVVQNYNAYSTSKKGETISYTPGNKLNTQLATAMDCDPVYGRAAVGGRERGTTLVDIATGKVVFKAKNLPPDPQTLLQHPVWPSAILFLRDSTTMAVGSAYKQVQIYDVRESSTTRRPTATTPEKLLEYRVMSLCQLDDYELAVGDAAGTIYSLDTRKLGRDLKGPIQKDMGRFVGPAGSVRQLKKHPTLNRLAAVGLDRMLRIYDTKTRKQTNCIYLKQRLNCVLFGGDDTWEGAKIANEGREGQDDWDIDQDDMVQDYVDSDDEQESNDGHEPEEPPTSQNKSGNGRGDLVSDSSSEEESDDNDDQEEEEESDDDDDDERKDDNDSSSDPHDDNDGDKNESGSDSSEEEVIIKAPKKKRRRN